jgi:hypothetical protein
MKWRPSRLAVLTLIVADLTVIALALASAQTLS